VPSAIFGISWRSSENIENENPAFRSRGEYTLATNGWTLIKVARLEGAPENPEAPSSATAAGTREAGRLGTRGACPCLSRERKARDPQAMSTMKRGK
jgi:hypothetical protein